MRAALVRVGVDQAYGGWNAPMDPESNEFVYVPIPDAGPFQSGLATPYHALRATLASFASVHGGVASAKVCLPAALTSLNMHLDPDFDHLTYGDKGRSIDKLVPGDIAVFYAGLRPTRPCQHRLVYAMIGLYRVAEVVRLSTVPQQRWAENAHTRRLKQRPEDIILRADPTRSGRLRRCIPIGEWRNGAYRVTRDLLTVWGGLSCKDGFIQRSAVPPTLNMPERFLEWLEEQRPELVAANN
jgi:putative DNA base modification enzyme with NMAD domain